jgi:hypothetical protein
MMLALFQTSQAANFEKLAESDWIRISSKNFDVITDLREADGRQIVEDLEAYRFFTVKLMGLKEIEDLKPLKILAIGSQYKLRQAGLPKNWAGVFTVNLMGYHAIASVYDYISDGKTGSFARQVLLHEYNHFMVRFTEDTHHYPMWVDEGMADYFGTFNFSDGKVTIGREPEDGGRSYSLFIGSAIILNSEKIMNTKKLPMRSDDDLDRLDVGRFYSQAFFIVHYLNSSAKLRTEFGNYMRDIDNGYKEADAMMRSFGKNHQQFDNDVKEYLSSNFSYRSFSLKEAKITLPTPTISIKKLDKPAFYTQMTEILLQFKFSENGKNEPWRDALIKKNLELNPHNADAQLYALIYKGNPDNLDASVKLSELNPNHAPSLGFAGYNFLTQAKTELMSGLPGWQAHLQKAQIYFRKAIALDPQFANAYYGLGETYTLLPDDESIQEGVVSYDTASLYDRNPQTFAKLAELDFRLKKPLDAIVPLRNHIAFSENGETSVYSIITDNLEILGTLSLSKGKTTAQGLVFENGVTYEGKTADGKPNGLGKITRPNGSYFEGNFVNGVMEGNGTIVTHGGYTYVGDFSKGIAQGKGVITYPKSFSAKTYQGDIDFGLPMGKGILVGDSGTYDGDFLRSDNHGTGTFTSAEGGLKYSGRWIYGNFVWPELDGKVFVGGISKSGKRNGFGTCRTISLPIKVTSCEYKDGVPQNKTDPSQDNPD